MSVAAGGRPVRRARGVPIRGCMGKVHVQYEDPDRGWVGACRAAEDLPPADGSASTVTCRWCANSGLAPPEWLTETARRPSDRKGNHR